MPIAEPPTYTAAQLESKAHELLTERFGQAVPIPVDVDWLAEQTEGVCLDYLRGLRERHNVDGAVFRDLDTGELLIYIDEWLADHNPNRYRMTVAEELAHVVLHRNVIEQITGPDDFQELHRHRRWHEMERNAKRFAAAILMPHQAVKRAAESWYPQLVRVAGYDNVEAVKKQLVSLMAKGFEVSTQTMNYRLSEWPMRIFDRIDESIRNRWDYLG